MDQPSVPVLVDSVRKDKGFERTRCVYYRVESDVESPVQPWADGPPESFSRKDTLVRLSSMAILTGPLADTPRFRTPELIQATFDGIEKGEHSLVATAHVWIPNASLACLGDGDCRQGDVLRLALPFFLACLRWSRAEADERFPASESDRVGPVEASLEETKAFRAWRRQVVEESKRIYHHPDKERQRRPKLRSWQERHRQKGGA